MTTFAVEAIGLTRQFDKKIAVDDLQLAVPPGEFFGFLGPNGAGKSTTIKMLVGLLRPTKGTARISGIDMWENPLEAKRQLGVLPEGLNLYDRLNAREFIRFAGTMYGLDSAETKKRTDELLDLMDLSDDADKLIIDYSQGMKKKTALAAALIHAPRVLFLDEPFEGVDVISKRAILDVLQRLRQSGTTIFFSSHILEVAERLCTSVAVIADGKLVAEGTIAELRERAQASDAATGVAATGVDATLEDLFLRAVGAENGVDNEGSLAWLG